LACCTGARPIATRWALTAGELRRVAIEHAADLQQLGEPGQGAVSISALGTRYYGCRTTGACTGQEKH